MLTNHNDPVTFIKIMDSLNFLFRDELNLLMDMVRGVNIVNRL